MLNILFPKECLICAKVGAWLCKRCEKKLVQTLPVCYICKTLSNEYCTHSNCHQSYSFQRIATIWKYNEYGKKLVHNYKYKHRFKVGDFLFSLFEHKITNLEMKDTVLIPLPSYKTKTLERGFNPTENLTELIAEKLKLPIEKELIVKTKSNINQASLDYTEREKNVTGVFSINEGRIKKIESYKQIFIVDDIITTGSTLNEVGKVLKNYIPQNTSINGLCIFQGNFRKYERKKYLQPNKEKKKEIRKNS